uniref:Glycosyltransferase n=1 Tax=viral metagenome TaxID=1070528 RepID=A0A6C0JT93_9ZZZZ
MKTISFLTSYGGQLFNPENDIDGSPGCFGSELALFEVGRRLGALTESNTPKYKISVYIAKPAGYFFYKWNMTWRSSEDWDKDTINQSPPVAPDIVVVCRYMNIFLDYTIPHTSKIVVWAHDPYFLPQWNGTYIADSLIANCVPFVNHWITVGDCQMLEKLAPRYNIPLAKQKSSQESEYYECNPFLISDKNNSITTMPTYTAIRNGITLERNFDPMNTKRQPLSFVYCSCPTRGLWILLEKWSLIKKHFPEATLSIYYTKSDESAQKFKPYENDPSIQYIGKVSQKVLFNKLKETDYWPYFCTFESCCTNSIENNYYGPIVLARAIGGLKENCLTDSLIREEDPDKWYDEMINRIKYLETHPEEKRDLRQRQFTFASLQTWDNRIPTWTKTLDNL